MKRSKGQMWLQIGYSRIEGKWYLHLRQVTDFGSVTLRTKVVDPFQLARSTPVSSSETTLRRILRNWADYLWTNRYNFRDEYWT